jgi:hypothetical protein
MSPLQSGFQPGDSTVNQLTFLYNSSYDALDYGHEICVVFFKISMAFNKVWHNGFLFWLQDAGIQEPFRNWFSNYLSNRRPSVVLPGAKSD